MKIILSRKSFDSATAGVASPILPDGRLCPLPIPHKMSSACYGGISMAGENLGRLVDDLAPSRISAKTPAHLDPDLSSQSLPRQPDWRPLFGQTGAAQSHLENQGVGPGDLFLFFGWFRQVERGKNGWRYLAAAPDLHLLYGWLQIERRFSAWDRNTCPDWALYHPHFQRQPHHANDSVYLATERLRLPGTTLNLPGGGVFACYDELLCLTAPGANRSLWRLPRCFYPEGKKPLTYHGDLRRWMANGDDVLLQTVAQGQEFVLDTGDYPEVFGWLAELYSTSIG